MSGVSDEEGSMGSRFMNKLPCGPFDFAVFTLRVFFFVCSLQSFIKGLSESTYQAVCTPPLF